MKRKDFIKGCGLACLGGLGISTLLSSCSSMQFASGDLEGEHLVISEKDFEENKDSRIRYKPYLIVSNDILSYPICVYRHGKGNYSALWMQCTHQGTELQVFGDRLQCPAHGSEFNSKGEITEGPAETSLRVFPVSLDKEKLRISLKAI